MFKLLGTYPHTYLVIPVRDYVPALVAGMGNSMVPGKVNHRDQGTYMRTVFFKGLALDQTPLPGDGFTAE
jgi:hypothetical protein